MKQYDKLEKIYAPSLAFRHGVGGNSSNMQ